LGGSEGTIEREIVNLPLVIRPEAEDDLAAARDWYEEQREGLGDEFLQCAQELLERISGMPEMYAVVYRGVRRCKLRRFPYIVYYRLRDGRIEVLGVLHASLHPRTWRSRA
jgi:plasmid stabilization system protein ParE